MLRRTIDLTGRQVTQKEFDRYYLRVYQHFGSREGYRVLGDTLPFLQYVQDKVQVRHSCSAGCSALLMPHCAYDAHVE